MPRPVRASARGADVQPQRFVLGYDSGTGIKRQRGVGRGLDELVEAGGGGQRVVVERGQMPLRVGADAQLLPGAPAMPDRAEHLRPRQRQLDRPLQHAGRQDRQNLRPVEDRLGAEATAQEWRAQQHILDRNAEIRRIGRAAQGKRLVGHVDRQPVAVPLRDDRMRLHRVVILRGRDIIDLRHQRGGGNARFHIAVGYARRPADADRRGT